MSNPSNYIPACGKHHFFFCEVVAVPDEGKVYLLYLCTDCGDAQCRPFSVAEKGAQIRLLKEEKKDA